MAASLAEQFGAIDIYIFDQLLRGRIAPGMRILDVGCGEGRNIFYLLKSGYDVSGADADARAIEAVRRLAATLAPGLPADHFRAEPVERMSFPDASFDVVIASALLHFARDDAQFDAMLGGCWRVLKSGGVFFARLASSIGLSGATPLGGRRFRLADGTDRYLVDAALLKQHTAALGGELLDTIKTTVVDDLRSMTTWVVRKDPVGPAPMNQGQLIDFANRYAAAWSSGDPDRLASFYADDGALIVNGGTPASGRAAVAATAKGFMTGFPDMVVRLDYLNQDGWKVRFHWLWTGTNTGPGGTGKSVRMRGYEEWTLTPEGKIKLSDGHYDDAEYQRQLKFGAPPPGA